MPDNYEQSYRRSLSDPENFWAEAAHGIDWIRPWDEVLDDSNAPFYRWFAGGTLNTCYNALDRHVEAGRGDQLALIHDSAMTGKKRQMTYAELRDETALFAGGLSGLGVGKGDRVIIYMPMVPEAVVVHACLCATGRRCTPWYLADSPQNELREANRRRTVRSVILVGESCGVEVKSRVVAYKPLLDAAVERSPITSPKHVRGAATSRAVQGRAPSASRHVDWMRGCLNSGAEPARVCVRRIERIRSTSSTRPARPASSKGRRARQRRPHGRPALER